MNKVRKRLTADYQRRLCAYVANQHEAALHQGYELGREAINNGLGVLDIARIHQAALSRLLVPSSGSPPHGDTLQAAETFFLDMLSPFEAAHRGFREANLELQQLIQTLEDRNAELATLNRSLQTEIAERQRLEEVWKRYESIVNTSKDFMTLISADFTYVAANNAFCRAQGRTREEIVGRSVGDIWSKSAFDRVIRPTLERCLSGHDVHYEAWFETPELGRRCFDVSYYPYSSSGTVTHVIVVTRDVTDRKTAEEKIARSEMMLAEAQQLAHLGSWEWDIRRNMITWSAELYRIYGLAPQSEAITYEGFLKRVDPRDRLRVAAIIRKTLDDGQPFTFQHRIVKPDGEERIVFAQGRIVADSSEKPVRMFGTGQDVTEMKKAEEALLTSEEHYRQLFTEAQAMQENLRNLSNRIVTVQEEERKRISRELHDDVGQALTAINVNLEVIRKDGIILSPDLEKRIVESQGLLALATEAIHRFARELRPAMLDDLGLAPALRSYVKGFARRTGIRVRFQGGRGVEGLDAERKTVIYRVAQESLTNVAKYAHAKEVVIRINGYRNRVCLQVTDDGRGFHFHSGIWRNGDKHLGLLGMQERVRLVHGNFRVETAPGRGTTIRVDIPVKTIG